ncbi:hypothetical protein ABIB25_000620 [Nakamurella sp. UYEF19]|uniref:SRPBCC family protein n=1 Tax=Nakamurella sp. UYEF19 TaxID=1756392 RepID=UPI00339466C3
MSRRPIYVETVIMSDLDRLWELTQNTDLHPRWDLRFSRITPTGITEDGSQRFRYELRVPLHRIAGTGISLGERRRPDDTRTSALRFTTRDRLSPLGDGRGYWRYVPTPDGVRFITGYDYRPGWGSAADAIGIRRFVGWMTAWSFDRLRIWAETGEPPETWPLYSVLAFWRQGRPRASRCRREPLRGQAMDDAPATLDRLEAP